MTDDDNYDNDDVINNKAHFTQNPKPCSTWGLRWEGNSHRRRWTMWKALWAQMSQHKHIVM